MAQQASANFDAHVHLYGCLTPAEIYELAEDGWDLRRARLLASPQASCREAVAFWEGPEGIHRLSQFLSPQHTRTFEQFQNCYNLIIVLFKISDGSKDHLTVARHILARRTCKAQYRVMFPWALSQEGRHHYFIDLAQCLEGSSSSWAVSLPRPPHLATQALLWLAHWLKSHPHFIKVMGHVDLCGQEDGYPPEDYQSFFQAASELFRGPLASMSVLYHVGEHWHSHSHASAIRWVYTASQFKTVERLGHALALWVDPQAYLGRTVTESVGEYRTHLNFLKSHKDELRNYGFSLSAHEEKVLQERLSGGPFLTWRVDEEEVERTQRFQEAIMEALAQKPVSIEVCPTANLTLSGVEGSFLKVSRLLDHHLHVLVGTDNPGLFGTELETEHQLFSKLMGGVEARPQ